MTEETTPTLQKLKRTSRLIAVVSDRVTYEAVVPFADSEWKPPLSKEERQSLSFRGRLSQDFRHPFFQLFPWSVLPLAFVLSFLQLIEWVYPALWIQIPPLWPEATTQGKVIGGALLFLLVAIPVVAAGFSYWIFVDRLVDRRLPAIVKLAMVLVTGFLVAYWLSNGMPRLGDLYDFTTFEFSNSLIDGVEAGTAIAAFWGSKAYRQISLVVFHVPLLLLIGILWSFVFAVFLAVLQWLFKLHSVNSTEKLEEFVQKPFPIWIGEGEKSLLELDSAEIDTLYRWAQTQGEIIQNKLIPTTLVLAIIAILVDTSIGDDLIKSAQKAFTDHLNQFESLWQTAQDSVTILAQMLVIATLLLIFVILPVVTIVFLLSEAEVASYLRQACLLVRQVKASDD